MADPDETRPSEIELEMLQRERLMELFSCVETFDGRESVIAFCEGLVSAQQED